jgi:hypothetical protein
MNLFSIYTTGMLVWLRHTTSVSDPDPHSMSSCIRIRNANADPEGGKTAQKRRKIKSEDQHKI